MTGDSILATLLAILVSTASFVSLYFFIEVIDKKSFPAWKAVALVLLVWGVVALMLSFQLAAFAVR